MEKPPMGNYEFTANFSVTNCVRYLGGTGVNGGDCLETKTTNFNVGDVVYSDRAFFNSDTMSWDIGFVLEGTNKAIPLSKVKKVSDSIPVTKMGSEIPASQEYPSQQFRTVTPATYFVSGLGVGFLIAVIFVILKKRKTHRSSNVSD